MQDLATLSSSSFTGLRGEMVTLRFEAGPPLEVILQSVTEQPQATAPDAPRTAFTVVFTCPAPCDIRGGTADIVHPQLETVGPVMVERMFPGVLATDRAYFKLDFN